MRVVIPGGSGQLGQVLARNLRAEGHEVYIVGRSQADPACRWDGRTRGPWWDLIDGSDVVINLTGRSVNCRYHWANLNEMMGSRLDSTIAVGQAIAAAANPPHVWLQASTATIYAHTFGEPHTEQNGTLGGHEPGVPDYWAYSVHIARAWELALAAANTPKTRKVALRTGFAMSSDPGGVYDVLARLARSGLGGPMTGGQQYVSWISSDDLLRSILFIVNHDTIEGPVNLTAPEPLTNAAFMRQLCADLQVRLALPINRPMASLGAVFLKTDAELMQKSRRVVPKRLLDEGFVFTHSTWQQASPVLCERWKQGGGRPLLNNAHAKLT